MSNNILVLYKTDDTLKVNSILKHTLLDTLSIKKINMDKIDNEDEIYKKIDHSAIISTYYKDESRGPLENNLFVAEYDSIDHIMFDINKINSLNKESIINSLKELYSRYKDLDNVYNESVRNKCCSINIPVKYYSSNYILIDIQFNYKNSEIIYIFRDKNNKKIYHKESSKNRYYYVDPNSKKGDADLIKKVSELSLKNDNKYKDSSDDEALYEQDIALDLRHSIDYYYNRKEQELSYKLKLLFWDIEVFLDKDKAFPTPKKAAKKINSISFKTNLDDNVHVYLLKLKEMDKSKIKKHKNIIVTIFDDEKELIKSFISKMHELDPDICCGWNTDDFDVPYVLNRMKKLNLNVESISPLNQIQYDKKYPDKYPIVFGLNFIDQLTLYKELNQNEEENYQLDTIAKKVLGKSKIKYEGGIDDMYTGDINKFIEYSGVDTLLLNELETALNHVATKFELIKVCSSNWKKSETTTGLVDPIVLKFAKNKGIVCKNKNYHDVNDDFEGACVLDPKIGLHKWVVDFDFKSLYPSIICTLNIGPNTYVGKVDKNIAKKFIYDKKSLPNIITIHKEPLKESTTETQITKKDFIDFIEKNNYIIAINGCIFKNHSDDISFFNEILVYLADSRDKYKKMMFEFGKLADNEIDEIKKQTLIDKQKEYDCTQAAYKIIMNSLYGLISNKFFRMYNINLAECITLTGQEVLKFTAFHLDKYMQTNDLNVDYNYFDSFDEKNLDYIIYGDTDSIFVSIGDYINK